MKKLIFSSIAIIVVIFNSIGQDIAPYIKIGESNETIQQVSDNVIEALKTNSFSVLGTYNPSNKSFKSYSVYKNRFKKYCYQSYGQRCSCSSV